MSEMFYWTVLEPGGDWGLGKITSAWPCPGSISSLKGATDIAAHAQGHSGVDIAAPEGTPVYAPCDALVRDVFAIGVGRDDWEATFGNSVILEHEGYVSLYAHLRDAPSVVEGTLVRRGTLLGYVGDTGLSEGPHLHWGLAPALFNGEPSYLPRETTIDPLAFVRDTRHPSGIDAPGEVKPGIAPLPGGEFLPEPDLADVAKFWAAVAGGNVSPDVEITPVKAKRAGWERYEVEIRQG